jgi:hypothetical protein
MRKLFFIAVLLIGACSVEKRSTQGTNPDVEIDVGGQTMTDSVTVTIAAPRAAAVGDRIPISIVVANRRDRQVELHLTGREPTFDIVVARADSTIVWRRLTSVTVMQILMLKPLNPGESFTVFDYWQPTEAGEYVIGAELPTDGNPLQAKPVTISIR